MPNALSTIITITVEVVEVVVVVVAVVIPLPLPERKFLRIFVSWLLYN